MIENVELKQLTGEEVLVFRVSLRKLLLGVS